MKIKVSKENIGNIDTDALVVNLFEGDKKPAGATGEVDKLLDGTISQLIQEDEITGKKNEVTLIHTLNKMPASRVMVVGLGEKAKFSSEVLRQVMGTAARRLRSVNVKRIASIAHGAGIGGMEATVSAQTIAEGALLGLYKFDKYKTLLNNRSSIDELAIVEQDDSKISLLKAGVNKGQIVAEATNFARDLGNEPANILTPTELANRAEKMAKRVGLEYESLDRKQMEKLGMGALLAVAAGSNRPPKFIILKYIGDPRNEDNNLALCGKGITFDSGGISIKPAEGMGAMKGDMAGGASVIGAMMAIAQIKPKINVMGIVPATENMSGGSAFHPGDVVRTMLGKTFEIISTDAEGRMVLADALSYAIEHKQKRLVDVATLTGAASVALGNLAAAIMGNDQSLINHIIYAGENSGERFWQLPMWEEYREQIVSDIADIKNSGGRAAGTIAGGYFIQEFTEGVPWAHLDIAALARTDRERGYTVKGHTGFPVRTLVRLAENLASVK
ncbi:MAG: leucyl aminopeptidase [Chloroflexi bacterium]|jgi:leucyl aminopeptidase|nr:MAG: leucyl aminopeptidase [Chloroflexota bacterium]